MDNRYYENVIKEMSDFFEKNGFILQEDGSYLNDTKKVLVEYSEERQMYLLKIADVSEGEVGEYIEAEAWLFDDTQNPKDATSVGVGFVSTLKEKMGIKSKRAVIDINDVALPTANKAGNMNITGFSKKALDVFPALKDAYKEHVAKYGNFLYLEFFGANLVPEVKRILTENEKRQVKKIYELLNEGFLKGDKDTADLAIAIAAAAAYKDDKVKQNLMTAFEESHHFYDAVKHFMPVFEKNKKLVLLLVK